MATYDEIRRGQRQDKKARRYEAIGDISKAVLGGIQAYNAAQGAIDAHKRQVQEQRWQEELPQVLQSEQFKTYQASQTSVRDLRKSIGDIDTQLAVPELTPAQRMTLNNQRNAAIGKVGNAMTEQIDSLAPLFQQFAQNPRAREMLTAEMDRAMTLGQAWSADQRQVVDRERQYAEGEASMIQDRARTRNQAWAQGYQVDPTGNVIGERPLEPGSREEADRENALDDRALDRQYKRTLMENAEQAGKLDQPIPLQYFKPADDALQTVADTTKAGPERDSALIDLAVEHGTITREQSTQLDDSDPEKTRRVLTQAIRSTITNRELEATNDKRRAPDVDVSSILKPEGAKAKEDEPLAAAEKRLAAKEKAKSDREADEALEKRKQAKIDEEARGLLKTVGTSKDPAERKRAMALLEELVGTKSAARLLNESIGLPGAM